MNKYTSIELSRLIQSKVPEVETGLWMLPSNNEAGFSLEEERWNDDDPPALRLDDVLTCIRVWGEKQGKMGVCDCCGKENIKQCFCVSGDVGVENWDFWNSHRLLTAYLADNGFGERTERVIRSIFEV